jgi:hypothetical protein
MKTLLSLISLLFGSGSILAAVAALVLYLGPA